MIRKFLFLLLCFFGVCCFLGQNFRGIVIVRDRGFSYFNQIYVTNLRTGRTVLVDPVGSFAVGVVVGDVVRFTSVFTERKDVVVGSGDVLDGSKNVVLLDVVYFDIGEVVVGRFRPSGDIRRDVLSIKVKDVVSPIKRAVGLPVPLGSDSVSSGTAPIGFGGGGFTMNVEAIYDMVSGERRRKERLKRYVVMRDGLGSVRRYFGDSYFRSLGIPDRFIDDFLQFVYGSEDIQVYIDGGKYDAIGLVMDKYLPVYLKRLRGSKLLELSLD